MRASRRKRFRALEHKDYPLDPPSTSMTSGLFELISDDALLDVMHHLALLPRDARGIDVHNAVLRTCRNLRALVLTCKRMRTLLDGPGIALQKEMAARAATQIVPPSLDSDFPFTQQIRCESLSAEQLAVLRDAIDKMASHCAGPCCQRVQNEFNRRNKRIGVVARRSTLLTCGTDGTRAFVSSRQRVYGSGIKEREHNRASVPESRMTSEWILLVNSENCKTERRVELATGDAGAPQSMRSNQSGTACAMIRPFHSIMNADDETPHSCVVVWDTRHAVQDDAERCSEMLSPPFDAAHRGAVNAQDAWWVSSENGEQLAVLWSTAYVHPMGTVVGSNADTACYYIAVYTPDHFAYDIETFVGPFSGKAQTVSPAASGVEAAIMLRKSAMGHGPGSLATRETAFHNVFCETRVEITHASALASGRRQPVPAHPMDMASCPSAVALSPAGDCIVAIHRKALSVLVEILIRTSDSVFVSVQSIDVTHWTTIGRGEPTVFDSHGDAAMLANRLKLPYNITFSPCGRFAAVVDQRPLFGMSVTNYAVVVLDMALRHERRGVRALPLAPVEDVAPRSLEWTAAGIWMQARYGALLLKNVWA